jgi:hypothetical protein
MVMFLSLMIMSLLAVAVCAAAFSAATRGMDRTEPRPRPPVAVEPPRFFARPPAQAVPAPSVPVEVLLSQIERHVQLEQAAAEAYLDLPTPDALHSRTASPLLN